MSLQLHSEEYKAKRRRPQFYPHEGAHLNLEEKLKVLLVSIAPPHNNCGGRIVMHRHLLERNPLTTNRALEEAVCNVSPDSLPCQNVSRVTLLEKSITSLLIAGRTLFRLVCGDEWSLRSHILTQHI